MEALVVSAATGALQPILGKLAELLGGEYKRFKGVRGEIKFLAKEHTMSEKENPNLQDKDWMKEVREMSYDIEDSLDEFMLRVDDKSAKPDGFMKKIKGLLEKTKTRRNIAKAFQDLKAQVKEVAERQARYKNEQTESNKSNTTVDQRALAIFKDVSKLVGIDGPKHELIKLLQREDGHPQQPVVVSIVGLAGLGKTTIANQLYQEIKGQYECGAFVSISRNPDMEKILRTILSEVKNKPYYKTEAGGIQQFIDEIKNFLEDKKYFIIIDDVWDVKAWETIQWAFSKSSPGSMIMTTTRIHDVAKSCCSLYDGSVYELRPLNEENSRRLFCNRIFGPGKEWPSNLDTVSNKILTKCGGLPLAIVAISSLLANKARNGAHSIKEWEQVETSIGHGLERDAGVKGMMEILSLSYFDLPYHRKACFLYLGIFPEDYVIDKDRLVRKWVAEGFIPAEPTYTLHESGEKCFNELINRNLILPGGINNITGEVERCLVHDTILDFIVSKARDENFVTVHGLPRLTPAPGNKVRRLTLQGKTEGDATLLSNQNYSNVRSLTTFGLFIGSPFSLLDFGLLRVMDLENCASLENHHLANIGELFRLKYLCLKGTSITELPEQIGELQYLETLNLFDCRITKLPTTIVRLKRLVNLLINGSTEGEARKYRCDTHGGFTRTRNMPDGIRSLQALEELDIIYVDLRTKASFLREIGELTKMRNLGIVCLCYPEADNAMYLENIKRLMSAVQQLNKLQSLHIESSVLRVLNDKEEKRYIVDFGYDISLEQPLCPEAWCPEPWCPTSLRKLVLRFPITGPPSWMKLLENLEELELFVNEFEQESLDILGGLPVLAFLDLVIITEEGKYRSSALKRLLFSCRCGYPSLRYLSFGYDEYGQWRNCISTPMLTFEAGSMPMLHELRINLDADTAIDVLTFRLDFGLKHLSQLTSFRCRLFGSKTNVALAAAVIRKIIRHINLKIDPCIACATTKDDSDHRERIKLPRRRRSADRPALPMPSAVADRVIRTSVDENCCLTTDKDNVQKQETTDMGNNARWFATALPVPTDLSFVLDSENVHRHTSCPTRKPSSSHVHQHRIKCRSTPCQGQSPPPSHKSELLQEAGHEAPNQIILGTSGTPTFGILEEPRLPACFTFGAGSSSAGVPIAPTSAPNSRDQNNALSLSSVFKNLSVQEPTSNYDMPSDATTSDAGSSKQGRCHGEQ